MGNNFLLSRRKHVGESEQGSLDFQVGRAWSILQVISNIHYLSNINNLFSYIYSNKFSGRKIRFHWQFETFLLDFVYIIFTTSIFDCLSSETTYIFKASFWVLLECHFITMLLVHNRNLKTFTISIVYKVLRINKFL